MRDLLRAFGMALLSWRLGVPSYALCADGHVHAPHDVCDQDA